MMIIIIILTIIIIMIIIIIIINNNNRIIIIIIIIIVKIIIIIIIIIITIMLFVNFQVCAPLQLAVDVGCGSGQSTEPLADHFKEVIGVDISQEQINKATQASRNNNVSYRFIQIIVNQWFP